MNNKWIRQKRMLIQKARPSFFQKKSAKILSRRGPPLQTKKKAVVSPAATSLAQSLEKKFGCLQERSRDWWQSRECPLIRQKKRERHIVIHGLEGIYCKQQGKRKRILTGEKTKGTRVKEKNREGRGDWKGTSSERLRLRRGSRRLKEL